MDPSDRAALESLVVDNTELAALEARIARFNLFEAVGLVRQEIRHSNFLAFLLDPSQPHGLGETFLKWLLQDTLSGEAAQKLHSLSPLQLHLEDLSGSIVRREWRNIDLLIENSDLKLVVAIENKIGICEHSDQLRRYRDTLDREYGAGWQTVLLLLSPKAAAPTHDAYLPIGYDTVHRLLVKTLNRFGSTLSPDIALVLRHYKELLATHVIDDPELDQLCDAIYRKHRRALDLIFDRRTRPFDAIAQAVHSWIDDHADVVVPNQTQRAYISFVPKEWLTFSRLVKPDGDKPRYSLGVLFTNGTTNGRISLELYGVNKVVQARFRKVAAENPKVFPGLSKGQGQKFATLYSVRHLTAADYTTDDVESLIQKVRDVLDDYLANVLPKQTEAFRAEEQASGQPLWADVENGSA